MEVRALSLEEEPQIINVSETDFSVPADSSDLPPLSTSPFQQEGALAL